MRKEHRAGLIGAAAGSFFTLLVLSVLTGVGTFQTNLKTFWSLVVLGGTLPGAVCLVVVAIESKEEPDRTPEPQILGSQPLDQVRDRYGDPGEQVAIAAGFSALTHPSSPRELTELLNAVQQFNYLPDPVPEPDVDYSLPVATPAPQVQTLPEPIPEPAPAPAARLYGETPEPEEDLWGHPPTAKDQHVIAAWE